MILKSVVIISVLVIVSEAAVIDHKPQAGDISFQTTVVKAIPPKPDTKEDWEKHRHINSDKDVHTDTPDLQRSEHTNVDVTQGIKSNSRTHHRENKFGHEKLTHSKGQNHIHTVGTRTVHSQSPTKSHDSVTNLERDTQTTAKDEERDQSLRNGKLHVDETDAKKKFHEHVVGDINTFDHPDADHVAASNVHYDDNDTTNTTHHDELTRRTLKHGHGSLDITDSNNVVNKSDVNTHNEQAELISETPEQRKKMKLRSDNVDSKDKTITTERLDATRETPISILNIVDENVEESNKETEKHQKEVEKSIDDKKGTETFIKENKYKEVTDNTLENTNTLTVHKRSKLPTATPITITFKTSSLDKQELRTNENNEKEVVTETPTTETVEGYKEESTSNYVYDALPDNEEGAEVENNNPPEVETDEQAPKGTTCEADTTDGKEEEEEDNGSGNNPENEGDGENDESPNDEDNNRKDNNFGSMVFLMPSSSNDNSPPKDFIDSALQSDIIQNLLNFIKSNNMSSKIMIAGPINDNNPDNLYNQIREHVKSYQTTLGIAEISISADIIQMYKEEKTTGTNKNKTEDTDKPNEETNDSGPAQTQSNTEEDSTNTSPSGDDNSSNNTASKPTAEKVYE